MCGKRRARRHCPGVGGEICALCCGTARENTVNCPSSCEFLQEARFHEVPPPVPQDKLPNQDIRLSERFIAQQEELVFALATALKISIDAKGAIDFDAREALESLIRTYRTLESGLIYETRPDNPYAAAILERLRETVEEFRKAVVEHASTLALPQNLRDADILGSLVFLQRLEYQYNNGRPKGRAFRDFLASYIPETAAPEVTA